jgi:O-antigen/teichoic acid export membrane protein
MRGFRSSVVGAGYLAVLPLVLNGISVFTTAYIIHRLGPQQYGQWAVAASLTASSAFLSNLGLRPIFVRRLAEEPTQAAELLADQLGARLLLGAFAALVAIAAAVALRYDATVLTCTAVAAVGLTLSVIWTALGDVLQASGHFGKFAAAQFASGVVLTALSVAAVRVGAGPVGVAGAYAIGPLANLALLTAIVRRRGVPIYPRWSVSRAWALLAESRHLGFQQFIVTVRDRADELLVPKLVGIAQFGYFSAGVMPSDRAAIVPDGVATSFYPAIASAAGAQRDAAARLMMLLTLAATIPVAIALVFVAPVIARILFPGDASFCRIVMQITAVSVPIAGAARCLTAGLQAAGQDKQAARAGTAATFIGAAVSLVLISQWGLVGAAASWLTRSIIQMVLLLPPFVRTFPSAFASPLPLGVEPELQG